MNALVNIAKPFFTIWFLSGACYAQEEVTTTVIDLLSQNVEFSYFLRLLQRNQLIPYLNELTDITLAAPVNSAFAASVCSSSGDFPPDNCIDEAFENFGLSSLNRYIINKPINFDSFQGYNIYSSIVDEENTADEYPVPILVHIDNETDVFTINSVDVVELDLYADSQNSYVQGLDRPLIYKSSHDVLSKIPDTTIAGELLKDVSTQNKTVLVPLDTSFDFEDYQYKYLFSNYGVDDSNLIINSLLIDGYYGGDIHVNVLNDNGYQVKLDSLNEGQQIVINDTLSSLNANKIAADSIIHVFDDRSLVEKIDFNVMKTLVGLDAGSFVDELILQGLSDLITNNSIEQTIFYLKDSSQISINSKSSNLYHFIDARIEDLSLAKPLYDTKYCKTKKFGDFCQRIKIEAIGEDTFMLNNNVLVEDGPYKVGNSVIYLTDDNVRTPGDIITSVNPVFHCSKSINYLTQLKLHKLPRNSAGYTILLPCFDAWNDFALTLNYLETNRSLLDSVMRNIVIETPIYTDFEGSDLEIKNLKGDLVSITNFTHDENDLLSFSFNNETITLHAYDDILFNQGVIHPIHELLIPEEVDVTLKKIITHSDADQFLQYLEVFPDLAKLLEERDYSILLPSSFSLSRIEPFKTNTTLEQFLRLHIIPPASLDSLYNCEDDIQTLNSKVNLTCTKVSGRGDYLLQIKDGADFGARVLSKGCTSHIKHSCIYVVDRPISPEWISDHYHLSLPGIALAVGILLGSVSMLVFLFCGMLIGLRKHKGGEDDTESGNSDEQQVSVNEATSLLNGDSDSNGYSGNNGYTQASFEQGYSDNANVDPVSFTKKKVSFVSGLT